MFVLGVLGTPPDAEYECVACDDGERTELLSDYWMNTYFGLKLYGTSRPTGADAGIGSYGPIPAGAVSWRTGLRYGVIWRNVRGEWYRKWIPAERVETGTAEESPRKGTKTIRIEKGGPVERLQADELTKLGLKWYVPGSPTATDCPGLLTSDYAQSLGMEADPIKFLSTSVELASSLLEKGEGDYRACRDVSWLCYLAPKALAQIPSATEDQRAAAGELENAYAGFVASLERSNEDAIRYLNRLKVLVQRIRGE